MKMKTIAAISPSGIHDPQKLRQSIEMVTNWGHRILVGPNHEAHFLATAGTIQQRLEDVHWANENPDIDIIWFNRGGYGTAQLLPHLPKILKPIIGFSDATALLSHLWNQEFQNLTPTMGFHGPVLNSLKSLCDPQSQEHIFQWLQSGKVPKLNAQHLLGPKVAIHGPMVGGNLCVLASLCGTPFQLQTKNCILALEDIAEPAYKIDRMLLQLEMSGLLKQIQGIVLGSFHNCHSPHNATWDLLDVFNERLKHLQIPVYHQAPFGHDEINWIWQMGGIQEFE